MTGRERRVAQRVPAQFRVSYVHEGDYLISHSKDISIDGMFLYTEKPAPINEKINLNFSIGDLNDVNFFAEVVWVNNSPSTNDSGMAVKFINLEPDIRDNILKIINRVAVLPEIPPDERE